MILRDPVLPEGLLPGAHFILITQDFEASTRLRRQGATLRDTLRVLEHGPGRFAFLFRMPIEGMTVAQNILRHGAGAINIDACRVRWQSEADREAGKPGTMPGEQESIFHTPDRSHLDPGDKQNSIGRWPSNLVGIHDPECLALGTRVTQAPTINRYTQLQFSTGHGAPPGGFSSTVGGDEVIPVWECSSRCPIAELDAQSGVSRGSSKIHMRGEASTFQAGASVSFSQGYDDMGGASRYYPQFANETALFDWFKALLTLPPKESTCTIP